MFVLVRLASNYLPPRYNPKNLTEKISIGQPSMDLTQFIHIERSWETNSLITRLELYSASLKMLEENPLAGVGVGRWNSLKQKFGFKAFLLIDSHNGYLSVLSQYGLLGIPLILFIYFFPSSVLYKSLKLQAPSNFLIYLGVINLYIAFADLSNSGIKLQEFLQYGIAFHNSNWNATEREITESDFRNMAKRIGGNAVGGNMVGGAYLPKKKLMNRAVNYNGY